MNQEKTGKFIKKLREEKKWTQEQLANKIPLGRDAVSKWENGKSLPDISALQKLSEIFSVSIEELLAGEKNPKENVTLELYEERNTFKRKFKIVVFVLFFLLLLFFFYYFINLYQSINVYTITSSGEKFEIDGGLLIKTNEKIYFNLGNIINLDNKKIDKLELFYVIDNNEKEILSTEEENILFFDYLGYEEYFDMKYYSSIIKNMYLKIYYDNTYEVLNLSFEEDYVNDNLIFSKKKSISKDYVKKDNKTLNYDLEKRIKSNFNTSDKENYYYSLKKDNKNIDITYISSSRELNVTIYKEDLIIEEYYYDLDTNEVYFDNYENDKYSFEYKKKYTCVSGDCGSERDMKDKSKFFKDLIEEIIK